MPISTAHKMAKLHSLVVEFFSKIQDICFGNFSSRNKLNTASAAGSMEGNETFNGDGVSKFLQSKQEEAKKFNTVLTRNVQLSGF